MKDDSKKSFADLISSVYAFYRIDCTPFALAVWWEACKPFDLDVVKDAMNRHVTNPDSGQYLPKPADVMKLIGGGTKDGSLIAWSKVDRAIRTVGSWQSVVFDDPIIHAVIRDMGTWPLLCSTEEKEYPFKANEFQTRYQGYRVRGGPGEFPPVMIGRSEGQNGFPLEPPTFIGDRVTCEQIMLGKQKLLA